MRIFAATLVQFVAIKTAIDGGIEQFYLARGAQPYHFQGGDIATQNPYFAIAILLFECVAYHLIKRHNIIILQTQVIRRVHHHQSTTFGRLVIGKIAHGQAYIVV